MKKINKPSSDNNILLEVYNFNGTEKAVIKGNKLYLSNTLHPNYHFMLEDIYNKELRCIYVDHDPVCENCGCNKLDKKYLDPRNINKNHLVEVTAYKCPECGELHRTPLYLFVDKYCTFSKEVKENAIQINFFEHVSLNNIALITKSQNGANPCKQTIFNDLKRYYGKLKNESRRYSVLSGNYGYDEQYIKLNGQKFYILALFDIELNILVDYIISENMKKDTVEKFIKNATENQKRISLTTDGKKMYGDIAENLGFIHNLCIFHLIKDLNEIVEKKLNNKKLDEDIKTKYKDDRKLIFKVLFQKKYYKAKKEFKNLLSNLDEFTSELKDFITKKIYPNFEKYMMHTKYDFLPATNNKMENYFGKTLPRYLKKLFKTVEGITIYLDLQRIKWEQNHGKIIFPMEFLT
jgi:transposase-like protein